MMGLQLAKGQHVEVRHPTGIVERGVVQAVRTYGGYPQVDVLWSDGTRSWVRPCDVR